MNIGILSANVLLADMAVCIRLQIERKGFESSAGLCKITCLLMGEFDSEEKVINQYSSQTKWCFGRMDICTGVKSRTSWFNSTEHHIY